MLEVGRQCQSVLPKHVAVHMLAERSFDNSWLNLLDPEGFPCGYLRGLQVGVDDELLLDFAVDVPEAIKAVDDGHIKALWIMATNPVDSMPDADQVRGRSRRARSSWFQTLRPRPTRCALRV
jgi:anaerobic selenocysteine-containing dehydrogenase